MDLVYTRAAAMAPGRVALGLEDDSEILFADFQDDKNKLLRIEVTDSPEEDLLSHFRHTSHFIDAHVSRGSVILIFSTLGISRSSTVILAYLMHRNKESLRRAWAHVQNCKNNIRPNRGFVKQLVEWEKVIHGAPVTDISDPLY